MTDQDGSYARIRHTATGALAALAVVGAIAGGAALAAKPHAKARGHAVATDGATIKAPAAPGANGVPTKIQNGTPEPPVNHQPFLDAIQRLVDNGTITAAEAQVVDREIVAGRIDTDSLVSSGFTQAQLDAVQQALVSIKSAMAATAHGGTSK